LDIKHPWYLLLELESPQTSSLTTIMETILTTAMDKGWANDAVLAASQAQRSTLWSIREEIPGLQKRAGASIKNDISVPMSAIPDLIRTASHAVETLTPGIRVVAFGHLGDGNLHFNLSQPVGADGKAFLARWDEITQLVHDIVAQLGGSFSAEHGIGQLKVDEMIRLKPALDLDLMRRIKTAFDPKSLMNPGKVVR
jgi:D-lactate dehydrogenase (cytochrome)